MAPPDAMEDTGGQLEAHQMPAAAAADDNTGDNQISDHRTFHRYMDLPPKIRKQIRTEAIMMPMGDERGKPFCSWLATVSKEWRDHVEEVLFSEIHIDATDEEQVTDFRRMMFYRDGARRRQRFLRRLNLAVDDSEAGPWHREGGFVQIARIMEQIGHLLTEVSSIKFATDGGRRRPLEIVFATSRFPYPRMFWPQDHRLITTTTSQWQYSRQMIATADYSIPLDLPKWAVHCEFPKSLDMVTHLTIPPDCVPMAAAFEIVSRMPNLETCVLEPRFSMDSEEAWESLSCLVESLLDDLRYSLRSLTLSNTNRSNHDVDPDNSGIGDTFSKTLLDWGDQLVSLRANPFELDDEFLRPFWLESEQPCPIEWNWPKLRHLDLQFFNFYVDDPEEITTELSGRYEKQVADKQALGSQQAPDGLGDTSVGLTTASILIAAGRATAVMPVLESAHISITSRGKENPGIFVKRKLCPKSGRTTGSRVWLTRIKFAGQRGNVMKAWADFLGPDPTIDENLKSEFYEPYGAEG